MTPSDPALREIAATGVRVGPLGFGGVPIGNLYRAVTSAEAVNAVDAAWDAGLRYFDTAPFYGFGLGERRLGVALADRPRDAYVLSTKVGRTLEPAHGRVVDHGIFENAPPFDASFDFSHDGVLRQVEHSLHRLGTDRLDAVVIHDLGLWHLGTMEAVEHHFGILRDGGLSALTRLREEGVVRAVGAGANELTMCNRFLATEGIDFLLLAMRFTLLDQTAFPATLEQARAHGKGIVVGSPFQSGLLATGSAAGGMANYAAANPATIEAVRAIEAVAAAAGVSLKALALQFPLRHPAVLSVLAGMRTAAEVRENAAAMAEPVPEAVWEALAERRIIPRASYRGEAA